MTIISTYMGVQNPKSTALVCLQMNFIRALKQLVCSHLLGLENTELRECGQLTEKFQHNKTSGKFTDNCRAKFKC